MVERPVLRKYIADSKAGIALERNSKEIKMTKKEEKKDVKIKANNLSDIPGVGETTEKKLLEAGILGIEAVATLTAKQLSDIAGMTPTSARKMIAEARELCGGLRFVTAEEIEERRSKVQRISTGSKVFDELIGGGVETNIITECYGIWGSSKTQVAHQLAVNVLSLSDDAVAIYIDSENCFRPDRIRQMAKSKGIDEELALKRIKVARCMNSIPDYETVIINTLEGLKKIEICGIVDKTFKTNSFSEKCGKININDVIGVVKHEYDGRQMIKVRTDSGREIVVTEEHSLFRLNEQGRPETATAKKLVVGDKIALPTILRTNEKDVSTIDLYELMSEEYVSFKGKSTNKIILRGDKIKWYKTGRKKATFINRYLEVDEDLCWLFGLLYAEGSTKYRFTLWTEKELLDRAEQIVQDKFGADCLHYSDTRQRCGYYLRVSPKLVTDVFKKLGLDVYEGHKHIPSWILNLPATKILSFLKGFWEGDGNHTTNAKTQVLKFHNSHKTLIDDLNILLLRLGIFATIKSYPYDTIDVKNKPFYHLCVYGIHPCDIDNLITATQRSTKFFKFGELVFDKITSLSEIEYSGKYLFDLSVKDNQNFVGGFGAVCLHNSDHQQLLVDEVERLIVEERLNVKLLVVDSVMSHLRAEYQARGALAERQQKLNKHLHQLSRLADMYDLAVFVTNQVMSKPDQFFGDPTEAVGGNILGHTINVRVYLRRAAKGTRMAKLVDSPNLPDGEAPFKVTENGIEDV